MDINHFFYYGENDQQSEIRNDLEATLYTPRRSMFYMRIFGSDIAEFENKPLSLSTKLLLRYNVVKAIANLNSYTSSGENGQRDRRVITSQNEIVINNDGQNINVQIGYLPIYDTNSKGQLDLSLGGV